MGERLRALLFRVLRVPPRPEPPLGSADSVLTFRASPRYFNYRLVLWALRQLGALAALIAGIIFLRSVADVVVARWMSGWLLVLIEVWAWSAFLLQLPIGYMMLRLDFEMRWYLLSDRSLRIREGLLVVREKTMAYANIQNITIRSNPLQRLFGLATVAVRAAGGGNGSDSSGGKTGPHTHEAYFEGVDNADRIREILRQRIRLYRDSGLGDPDDVADADTDPAYAAMIAVAGGALNGEAGEDVLGAARAVLEEVVALRASGITAYARSRP